MSEIQQGVENFDWDALENNGVARNADEKARQEAEYDKTLSTLKEKEVFEGVVISLNKREVVRRHRKPQ